MTPEQFKALGLKEGDPIHVTVTGQVTTVEDPAEYRHPLRLVGPSGSIFWTALDDVAEIKIDETVEAPLAVGDRVTWGSGVSPYRLVYIEGKHAVVFADGWAVSVLLSALRRADA